MTLETKGAADSLLEEQEQNLNGLKAIQVTPIAAPGTLG